MEPNPIRTASHIGLWIAVIGIGGWLVWSATHSSTENNRYATGSNHAEVVENNYPLSLHPCGAFFSFTEQKKEKPSK